MKKSPYHNKDITKWKKITDTLIKNHPISEEEIIETVLKS
jgi:hypothetical protein